MNNPVPTTSTRPMIAITGRSMCGYGELVRRSMSDPRRDVRPGLPWPVEVPVPAAQVEGDDRGEPDVDNDREEHEVLRPAIGRQPDAGARRAGAIEPGPQRQHGDEQTREHHAADEGAVDGERAEVDRRVGDDLL